MVAFSSLGDIPVVVAMSLGGIVVVAISSSLGGIVVVDHIVVVGVICARACGGNMGGGYCVLPLPRGAGVLPPRR